MRKPTPTQRVIDVRAETQATMIRLASRLKNERKRQGLTQRQLGARVGMTQSAIADLENMHQLGYIPTLGPMVRLAKGLGMEIDFTLERKR